MSPIMNRLEEFAGADSSYIVLLYGVVIASGVNEDIGVSPNLYFRGGEGGAILLPRRYSDSVFS